ncbi:hypothetical protein FA13DRAFT_1757476 [Coprinellus micaceus]|uniref:DUF4218 domain-containing protein n=1 Tax=Coprinellus micaceus TaxID=71717 RepID=A0A4Y7SIS6_COPMI|nr:hypothetical protein FA13DRAFT_1757476 [Coprinellus micaceus]
MHLIYENLIKNLVLLWTGQFKELDHDGQGYRVADAVWATIGNASKKSKSTIPSTYGAAPRDPVNERSQMTADNWSFWAMYLGPIFLERKFTNAAFYSHFIDLVELINICLQFDMKRSDIQIVREGFEKWVANYERLYFQYDLDRLSACPLTVHALLHIADGIEAMGPVWAYWAFALERFCGKLGRTIKSRRSPWKNLDNRLLLAVQMTHVKNMYGLHEELRLGPTKKGEPAVPPGTMTKIIGALATRYSPPHGKALKASIVRRHIKCARIEVWGKLRRLDGGDTMHASHVIGAHATDRRDATFVRYEVYVDINARKRKRKIRLQLKTFYGQLQYLYLIHIPAARDLRLDHPEVVVLAAIRRCKTTRSLSRLDMHYYLEDGELDLVDAATVQCLVARVPWRKQWVIFDRSGTVGRCEEEEGADPGSDNE